MHRNIDEIEFTIFDTETTGLDPLGGDRIVEIAAIRFKGSVRLAVFQSLINPGRPVSSAAFAVNHITEEMLCGAPLAVEVIPRFLEFISDSCLCSYNAPFDLGFLNNEIREIVNAQGKRGVGLIQLPHSGSNKPEEKIVVDILKMAKSLLPEIPRYALWFVAGQLGVEAQQQHRAFSDVEMTLAVFFKLKERLKNKGVGDFINFSTLFGLGSRFLDDISTQKIAKLQEALDLGARIKLKYLSRSTAEVSEREVLPREIRKEKKYHYLIGYCSLRQEERSFRVDHILSLELLL